MDSWISMSNILDITLEVLHIDGVETNNSWIETNVNLCKLFAKEIWSVRVFEYFLDAVEGAEKPFHMTLIYFLDSVLEWVS